MPVGDEQVQKVVSDIDALILRLKTAVTAKDRRLGWTPENVAAWIDTLEKTRSEFVRNPAKSRDLWLVGGVARDLDGLGTTEGELAQALYSLAAELGLLGTDQTGPVFGGHLHPIRATVSMWRDGEGWGVLSASVIPGGVWTHFSHVEMDGYKTLTAGQAVEVEIEDLGGPYQDGYRYRAIRVVPVS